MRYLIYSLLFLGSISNLLAQDSLAIKMKWLSKARPTTNLFVHFDKNVYANNETVYFTGYVLELDSMATSNHRLMAVALIREADSAIIAQGKFYMSNGLSFGNLTIPDKVITGNYYFLAYTDQVINGTPELMFSQPITLKTASDPPFKATMSILSNTKDVLDDKKILINVMSAEGRFLPNPVHISYRYGKHTFFSKADKSGQLLISLPPLSNFQNPNLYVKIKYGRDSNFISMAIPQPKQKASVGFYPEGGNLITGMPTKIAWEVKDQQKLPLLTKAVLYKNDEIIDTLETNDYGIGNFKLLPEKLATYKVKLLHSSIIDSTYFLPSPHKKGLTIEISNAVITDTLTVLIRKSIPGKIIIRVHNFQASYLNTQFDMKHDAQKLKIALTDVPKGLATLTITDTLDRPLAERMFFAHYTQQKLIHLASDKLIYQQREKITLKIKLTDPKLQGIASVACVQDGRLLTKNMKDIVNYTYLDNELKQLPQNLNGNTMSDKKLIEQILLVKGWRRYNWQILNDITEQLPISGERLTFSGKLNYVKKNVQIKNIITFGSPTPLLISLDSLGNFIVDSDHMVEKPGTKLFFLLNNPDRLRVNFNYQIQLNDPYLALNKKLALQVNPELPILSSALRNNSDLILKNNERAIQLKEVIIGNQNSPVIGNACGDYICPYNILNCVNHIGFKTNTKPYIGRFYTAYSGRPEKIKYLGCDEPNESMFFKADPVFLEKELYLSDYKEPQEPAFFSTIYWNYGLILSGTKEAEVEFYTSDITGKFRVVIQGITNQDVVYAEHYFEVKPKANP